MGGMPYLTLPYLTLPYAVPQQQMGGMPPNMMGGGMGMGQQMGGRPF